MVKVLSVIVLAVVVPILLYSVVTWRPVRGFVVYIVTAALAVLAYVIAHIRKPLVASLITLGLIWLVTTLDVFIAAPDDQNLTAYIAVNIVGYALLLLAAAVLVSRNALVIAVFLSIASFVGQVLLFGGPEIRISSPYVVMGLLGLGVFIWLIVRVIERLVLRQNLALLRAARAAERSAEDAAVKSDLAREIHHRVKNNLQLISSLISLQLAHASNDEERSVLRQTGLRIASMSVLQHIAYNRNEASRVDIAYYIQSLLQNLAAQFDTIEEDLAVRVELESVVVPIDVATPIGLIVTELVSNCFTHAYRDGVVGCVEVRMSGGDPVRLSVGDEGTVPVNFREIGLGLELVGELAEQIGADVSYSGDAGSMFRLEFYV